MAPKKAISSSKKSADTASVSQTSIPENSIILSSSGKSRNMIFKDVKDKILVAPETSELKPVLIEAVPFTSTSRNLNTFTLHNYRSYCNVDMAAAHLSKSKELKEQLKNRNLNLKTSRTTTLVVVKDLVESNLDNVVSFNKACAIMSANVLKYLFEEEFDWTKKEYISVKIDEKEKIKANPSFINRLAGQMGMTTDNPYYWMIVPGYEFLYELYPAETLAYTLVRLQYRKNLNIKDSITDADIVSSLVMKMNRFHSLDSTDFDDIITLLGEENISIAYGALSEDIGVTSRDKRNDEAIVKFKELITKLTSNLQK